ncbi:MAG: hypothetical protein HZA93_14840 [Verrucomicrobia bacterium]|nr:hypothetical protein [Verrucomicrobiota bacterium]
MAAKAPQLFADPRLDLVRLADGRPRTGRVAATQRTNSGVRLVVEESSAVATAMEIDKAGADDPAAAELTFGDNSFRRGRARGADDGWWRRHARAGNTRRASIRIGRPKRTRR